MEEATCLSSLPRFVCLALQESFNKENKEDVESEIILKEEMEGNKAKAFLTANLHAYNSANCCWEAEHTKEGRLTAQAKTQDGEMAMKPSIPRTAQASTTG